MTIIVVCGSRLACRENRVAAYEKVLRSFLETWISKYGTDLMIVEGNCEGVDQMMGRLADEHGVAHAKVPANWAYYGARAGPLRNQWMLALQPTAVVSFHHDLQHSKGTKNMMLAAQKADVRTLEVKV